MPSGRSAKPFGETPGDSDPVAEFESRHGGATTRSIRPNSRRGANQEGLKQETVGDFRPFVTIHGTRRRGLLLGCIRALRHQVGQVLARRRGPGCAFRR